MKRILLPILWGFSVCGLAETVALKPESMAYVLQADSLAASREAVVERLASCGRDVIVLDAAYNTAAKGPWTVEELAKIRQGKAGRRVLAYVSIGEAEDYRPYWQKNWDADKDGKPDASAPAFLNTENPDWKGNYRVRFWQSEWQKIMLPAVDQVVQQGFDGIYLDIVDAFEFYEYDAVSKDWQDNRVNSETGRPYRQDMIAWVETIAKRARAKNPRFWVIPQNAAALLQDKKYRQMISGIGVEDLLVKGKRLSRETEMRHVIGFLEKLKAEGKPILLIDYPKSDSIHAAAFDQAAKLGFSLLLTDRELTTLGESR
ncbi:MJ1477/TM1410 family putative glycoside hydrolase [Prosthecobacter algae]